MTNSKITEREIYTAIINGEDIDRDVLVEFAEKKLAQLDKRNASAKARNERKRAEGDAITEGVFAVLTGEPMTRAQVTVAYNEANGTELSEAKIGARLNILFKDERVQKENVKVTGADGRASTKVGYFIAE